MSRLLAIGSRWQSKSSGACWRWRRRASGPRRAKQIAGTQATAMHATDQYLSNQLGANPNTDLFDGHCLGSPDCFSSLAVCSFRRRGKKLTIDQADDNR
jgi:hypothetical protein